MCDSLLPLCSEKKQQKKRHFQLRYCANVRQSLVTAVCDSEREDLQRPGDKQTTSVSPCVALWPPAMLTPGSASRSSPAGGGWSRPPSCVRRSSTRLPLWTGPSGCRPTCPRTRRRTSRRRSWWACSRPTQRWRRRAARRSSPGRRKPHLVIRVKENNGGAAGERRRGTKHEISRKSKTSVRVCKNHYSEVVSGGMWLGIDFLFCFNICEQELWSFSLQLQLFVVLIYLTIDNFTLLYFKRSLWAAVYADLRVRMLSRGEQRWMFFFISRYQADTRVSLHKIH